MAKNSREMESESGLVTPRGNGGDPLYVIRSGYQEIYLDFSNNLNVRRVLRTGGPASTMRIVPVFHRASFPKRNLTAPPHAFPSVWRRLRLRRASLMAGFIPPARYIMGGYRIPWYLGSKQWPGERCLWNLT
jgi:hypothetical protein